MGSKPKGKAKGKKAAKAKSAAKGRSIKNAAGAENAAPVKTKIKQIDAKAFQNVHRRRTALKKQGKEIGGSLGELLTNAAETNNLDKPAYSFIEKLWAMSPQKRLTSIACLKYYMTIPHFSTGKLIEEDESGQGELNIPRQEAGAGKGGKPRAPAHDPAANGGGKAPAAETSGTTGEPAKPAETSGTEPKDLRPTHLRTVAEGGTRVDHDDDVKKAAVH